MNLLVIEDDRKLNRMLCEILEKEGYTVKACTDGEEALTICSRTPTTWRWWTGCSPAKAGRTSCGKAAARGS